MNRSGLISIIISTYNAAETLEACLISYIDQTYEKKELIIVDGASNDDTLKITNRFRSHITQLISEPDTGIYNAWNKALNLASGDWLYFLGADDYFKDKNVLEQVAEQLNIISTETNIVYGRVDYVNTHGDFLYSRGEPWDKVGKQYRQQMTIPHQGVFHRASLFSKYGKFDETFRIAGDYEMLLRELKDKSAIYLPITISAMRQAGASSQQSNSLLIINELRKAQLKNGIHNAGLSWYFALVRVYIRIIVWKLLGEKIARKLLDIGRFLMRKPPHWNKNI